jgi:hypothetical protein
MGLIAQNMIAILLGSVVNTIGEPMWPLDEHGVLHFDME